MSRFLQIFFLAFLQIICIQNACASTDAKTTPLFFTSTEKDFLKTHPIISVANEQDWPPFDYYEFGRPKGLSIDYIKMLAEIIGIEIKFINGYSWAKLLSLFKDGKIDVMPVLYKNQQRRAYTLYTSPYYKGKLGIFSNHSRVNIHNIDNLNHKKVGIQKAHGSIPFIRLQIADINFVEYENTVDMVKDLATQKLDAIIGNPLLFYHHAKSNQITNIQLTGYIEIKNMQQNITSMHMGVRKDLPLLHQILQKAINSVSDKEMQLIENRWAGFQQVAPDYLKISSASSIHQMVTLTLAEQQFVRNNPVIYLAGGKSFAPFIIPNHQGKVTGIDIDILNLITERTGLKFNVKPGTWAQMQQRARNRELDGLTTASPSKERELYYNISAPYLKLSDLVIVKRGNPQNIHSIDDITGKRVALQRGNSLGKILPADGGIFEVVYFDSMHDVIKAIISNKADLTILEESAFYLARQLGLENMIEATFTTGQDVPLHFQLRNDWPELVTIVNKGLKSISNKEKFEIKDRWLGSKKGLIDADGLIIFTEEERSFLAENDLTVCTYPNRMPYNLINKKGQPQGMVADYLTLFEKRTGERIFSLPPQASKETIDLILEGACNVVVFIDKNEENTEHFDFTTPIISFPYVIATTTDKLFIENIGTELDNIFAVHSDSPIIGKLKKKYPNIKLLEVHSIREGLEQVRSAEVFGYIDTSAAIGYIIQNKFMLEIKIAGKTSLNIEYAVATQKDEPMLKNIFQKIVGSLTDDEKKTIYKQWIDAPIKPTTDYILVWKTLLAAAIIMTAMTYYNRKLAKEKRRAENALRIEREAMKQNLNFVDMVSHEYRTPLSVLTSSLDLLERNASCKQQPDLSKQITRMRKSTSRLLNIFETSLDEKRINDAIIKVTKKQFKLTRLIERIADDCRNVYPTHIIQINNKTNGNELLTADADLLNIAMSNVLDNACKYSPSNSSVIVQYEKKGTYAVITFADQGVGIHPEEIEKIFEKYYRSATVGDKIGGGVGLFLVKKIIALHSGTISISSQPTEGTLLTIKLPLHGDGSA